MFPFCKKQIIFCLLFVLAQKLVIAQELYPLNEPASNVPKGVLGVRAFDDTYKEINQARNLMGLRLMYGLLPRLTIMATASVSNHHDRNFPANLVSHTHNGNQSTYSTGNFQRGLVYPYLFTGIYLYAKYRFISVDGEQKHFRMAAYGEWSNVKVAHDETEPDLLDDTKGFGGGLITTYLNHHFAVSLTSGVIIPGAYNGLSPDLYGGPLVPTEIKYGRAVKYNVSFGYLLFPRKYENYDQGNWNLYLEFMGKAYEGAKVTQYGVTPVPVSTPLLKAGNYMDVCPGIQYIVKSNLRIDLSAEFPMINKSYAHFYPMVMLGVQRYFYFRKK
ncbi:MAG: hypothetical protein JWP12_3875 [Bacteroidetes bacterium]|nr:hypothetical protein [Bacteroidota bacterium]